MQIKVHMGTIQHRKEKNEGTEGLNEGNGYKANCFSSFNWHEFLLCLVVDTAQKIYLMLKYKIHVEFHSFYYEWIIYCIKVHWVA